MWTKNHVNNRPIKETVLKRYLDSNGVTVTELSRASGVNLGPLQNFVDGRSLPSLRTAQKIAKALGTTTDELWPMDDK